MHFFTGQKNKEHYLCIFQTFLEDASPKIILPKKLFRNSNVTKPTVSAMFAMLTMEL